MKLSNTMILNETLLPSNKKAFTLAEVLITLSILGVVAALTIPSLVNRQSEMAAITKMKKAISQYEQVGEIFMVENETTDLATMPGASCANISQFFKVVATVQANACIFTTADGVVWSINPTTGYATIVDSARSPRYGVVMWARGGIVNGTQTTGINGDTRPLAANLAETPVGKTIQGETAAIAAPTHNFYGPANMLNIQRSQNQGVGDGGAYATPSGVTFGE